MDYPGAWQLGYVKKFFEELPWWTLIPDIKHKAVVDGYGDWSKPNYVTTAVSNDKKLMVSYIPFTQPVTIDFGYLAGDRFRIKWFDPVTGSVIKELNVDGKSVQRLSTPTGEDMVLVIESLEREKEIK